MTLINSTESKIHHKVASSTLAGGYYFGAFATISLSKLFPEHNNDICFKLVNQYGGLGEKG